MNMRQKALQESAMAKLRIVENMWSVKGQSSLFTPPRRPDPAMSRLQIRSTHSSGWRALTESVASAALEIRRAGFRAEASLFLLLCMTSVGLCQGSSAGDIRGTVTDASGAVIPGATVTLLEIQTGVAKKLITNKSGIYDAVSVLPGHYTLTFEKGGFATFVHSGIILEAGATTVNASLSTGSVAQEVHVNAEGTLLQTDTGEQTTTLESKTMAELPNVGSTWANFTQTLPGVVGTGTQISVNGNMPYADNFLSDGGTIVYGNSANVDTGIFETIAEVKIDTSNFDAQYGSGGAVLNQITKSGTNRFHGAVYDYVQNDFFNAKTYFSLAVPMERYNNWGGAIGGPIFRGKAFFYFNYDGLHNNSVSYPYATFPTLAMRSGDLSDPSFPTIYDPATLVGGVRQPFTGNKIPSNRLDPVAVKIQSYFPLPNLPGNVNNWHGPQASITPLTRYFGRFDYNFTGTNRLTGTVFHHNNPTNAANPECPLNCQAGVGYGYQAQITDVWTISAAAVNEFRIAMLRDPTYEVPPSLNKGYPDTIGLQYAKADIFPKATMSGSGGFAGSSIGPGVAAAQVQNTLEPSDVFTLVTGKHILKFGGEFLVEQDDVTQWGNVQAGNFAFTGYYTQQSPTSSKTGMGYADFLLGQVQSWSATNSPLVGMRNKGVQAFAQDDWKPLPTLTLNVGLRFQHQGPWTEEHNRIGTFDPNLMNPITHTPGAIWFGGNPGRTSLQQAVNHVYPRLGFSWSPRTDLAVRGGAGLYTYMWSSDEYAATAEGFGINSTGSLSDTARLNPLFLLSAPNPLLNYVASSTDPGAYNGHAVSYYPLHTPTALIEEYSLSVERQLGHGAVAELAYVGSHGAHLSFPVDINQVPESLLGPGNALLKQPYPQYLAINGDNYNAISNYNSMQISFKKDLDHGLAYNVNFTWSKMLDEQDSAGWGGKGGAQPYQNAYNPSTNYAASNFDVPLSLKGSVVYELPFGKSQHWLNKNAAVDAILGGWRASGIINLRSGLPYTVVVGSANLSGAQGGSWYPNLVGNPHGIHPTIVEWFNVAAYAVPSAYTFGNSGRNTLRGPGLAATNLSLGKNFPFTEFSSPMNLQVRVDAFNAFNHTNLANPNANIGTGGAGTITGTTMSGRVLQLGARFSF
jgi:hypothetical protein